MARVALLFLGVAALVRLVVRLQPLRIRRDLARDVIEAHLGVLQAHRLRVLVVGGVAGVPGLDRGLVDRGGRGVARHRHHREAHFALLVLEREDALQLGGGEEIGDLQALRQVLHLHGAALLRLEAGGAHAELRQHAAIGRGVELAVDLEGLLGAYRLTQLGVADAIAVVGRGLVQQRLARELLDQLLLQLLLLRFRDLGAQLLLVLRLALLPGLLQRRDRHGLAVHLQAEIRADEVEVGDAVGAP
jgi:hypothetical protein